MRSRFSDFRAELKLVSEVKPVREVFRTPIRSYCRFRIEFNNRNRRKLKAKLNSFSYIIPI